MSLKWLASITEIMCYTQSVHLCVFRIDSRMWGLNNIILSVHLSVQLSATPTGTPLLIASSSTCLIVLLLVKYYLLFACRAGGGTRWMGKKSFSYANISFCNMMEKQNYMYSEKSDGCMNSCIVDNSLVCGML